MLHGFGLDRTPAREHRGAYAWPADSHERRSSSSRSHLPASIVILGKAPPHASRDMARVKIHVSAGVGWLAPPGRLSEQCALGGQDTRLGPGGPWK